MPIDPSLVVEGLDTAAGLLSLSKKIIDGVKKVIYYKEACLELGVDSARLYALLERNKTSIDRLGNVHMLRNCLFECLDFVIQCQSWTIFTVTIEVAFRHRFPKLKQELEKLIGRLSMELNVEGFSTMVELREDVKRDHQEAAEQQIQIYDEFRSVGRDVRTMRDEMKQNLFTRINIRELVAYYDENDRRIDLHYDEQLAILRGTLLDNGEPVSVICYKYRDSEIGGVPGLPRIAHIYERISKRVQFQRFWGIYEAAGTRYSIMEDVSSSVKLCSAIEHQQAPSLINKLRIAYEIANAMAYLHQVGMLLKSLTDATVYLKVVNGVTKPIITGLESARQIFETTTSSLFDVRYEAREYADDRCHTLYTDVWSLGIVLWQCLTWDFPFQLRAEAIQEDRINEFRQQFREQLPWGDHSMNEAEWGECVSIISQCWETTPTLRPSSARLAQQLVGVYTRLCARSAEPLASSSPLLPNGDLPAIRKRCWELVEFTRKQKNPPSSKEKLSTIDFRILLEKTEGEFDPLSSFLVGAAIWQQVMDFNDWDDEYVHAYDLSSDAIRAHRALRYLTPAADNGYPEAGREASEAYAFLSGLYRERYNVGRRLKET